MRGTATAPTPPWVWWHAAQSASGGRLTHDMTTLGAVGVTDGVAVGATLAACRSGRTTTSTNTPPRPMSPTRTARLIWYPNRRSRRRISRSNLLLEDQPARRPRQLGERDEIGRAS